MAHNKPHSHKPHNGTDKPSTSTDNTRDNTTDNTSHDTPDTTQNPFIYYISSLTGLLLLWTKKMHIHLVLATILYDIGIILSYLQLFIQTVLMSPFLILSFGIKTVLLFIFNLLIGFKTLLFLPAIILFSNNGLTMMLLLSIYILYSIYMRLHTMTDSSVTHKLYHYLKQNGKTTNNSIKKLNKRIQSNTHKVNDHIDQNINTVIHTVKRSENSLGGHIRNYNCASVHNLNRIEAGIKSIHYDHNIIRSIDCKVGQLTHNMGTCTNEVFNLERKLDDYAVMIRDGQEIAESKLNDLETHVHDQRFESINAYNTINEKLDSIGDGSNVGMKQLETKIVGIGMDVKEAKEDIQQEIEAAKSDIIASCDNNKDGIIAAITSNSCDIDILDFLKDKDVVANSITCTTITSD